MSVEAAAGSMLGNTGSAILGMAYESIVPTISKPDIGYGLDLAVQLGLGPLMGEATETPPIRIKLEEP